MSFPLLPGDAATQAAMDSIRSLGGTHFFINLSEAAGPLASSGIAALLVLVLILSRRFRLLLGLAVAFAGSNLAWVVLKQLILRPRPGIAHAALIESGWSFPSGHATNAFALATFVGLILGRHLTGWTRSLTIVSIFALACAIAFARAYLGVHYLSDVIAGALLGAAFGGLGAYASRTHGVSRGASAPAA